MSRRALFSKTVNTGALVVATTTLVAPNVASAAAADAQKRKGGKGKPAFRGGKEGLDSLHNGTDLNGKQAVVAGGLLDKMGLQDITPDKGPNTRTSK
jgi:hypothetical protein